MGEATPVALSAEEREDLLRLRGNEMAALVAVGHLDPSVSVQCSRTVALLDRLLGGKP